METHDYIIKLIKMYVNMLYVDIVRIYIYSTYIYHLAKYIIHVYTYWSWIQEFISILIVFV